MPTEYQYNPSTEVQWDYMNPQVQAFLKTSGGPYTRAGFAAWAKAQGVEPPTVQAEETPPVTAPSPVQQPAQAVPDATSYTPPAAVQFQPPNSIITAPQTATSPFTQPLQRSPSFSMQNFSYSRFNPSGTGKNWWEMDWA